eukprot:scaffold11799_cov32-Attheya_sp.AAC.1
MYLKLSPINGLYCLIWKGWNNSEVDCFTDEFILRGGGSVLYGPDQQAERGGLQAVWQQECGRACLLFGISCQAEGPSLQGR